MSRDIPRVAFVIDDLGHGGAQRQLFLSIGALAGRVEPRVVVLSSRVEPYAARLAARGVAVVSIPRRSGADFTRAAALTRVVRAERVDLVHGILDASNVYAFIAGRSARVPTVLSLRSDRVRMTGIRGRALRWMLRHADAVTVNSEAGRAYLCGRAGVAEARVYLVPNIVETAEPGTLPAAAARPLIGCVGRLAAVKRFEAVIAALPAVRAHVPDAALVIVGDGPCRERLQAAASGGEVEFTGAVDDARPQVARFACLVVASEHEGLTNAALEALSLGVPVVAVPAGDLPRVVSDGVTGVIARDGSPHALAEAIVRALNPRLRASAAVEGPRLVRERFAPANARDALTALYQRLLTQSGAVPRR